MPSNRPLVRLEDILKNVERIARYVQDVQFHDFARDEKTQDAVERCLLRIAEAARKLEGTAEQLAPDQPWPAIRAFGNVIRHEYDTVSPVVIGQVVTEDLATLRAAVATAIETIRSTSDK